MKNIQVPPETKTSFAKDSLPKVIHLGILAALATNALLLSVIAFQIKQVGNQLTSLSNHDRLPTIEQYAHAGTPGFEQPYEARFAKNETYSAYRASNSDPIPVRIVGTPLKVFVDNGYYDPIPVKVSD